MYIKPYFDTEPWRVLNRQYNIFIPICLGNKFFSAKNRPTNNVRDYLDWALDFTKEKVLFIIVDDIQITNYVARRPVSRATNLKNLARDAKEIRSNIELLTSFYPIHHQNNMDIIQWKDYAAEDPYVGSITQIVYDEFRNNELFRNDVIKTVKASVTDRKFSEDKYLLLCNYILDEFALCYSGTEYKGTYFGTFIYPESDATSDFIEKIKHRQTFPELYDKLPKDKAVFTMLS
jgi:tRNA-dependent cyclodipeptide synthase